MAEAITEVRNPYDQELVGTVPQQSADDVRAAVGRAGASLEVAFPAHERYRVLMAASHLLDDASDEVAELLAREGSKTIREARNEPPRSAEILRLAADAARRIQGQTLPFDVKPGSENRRGYYMRVPVGVVGAILPFNDPLAVAAHKLGPAIAAGNAVILKPDSRTPFAPMRLVELLYEAGLPKDRVQLITGEGAVVGAALVQDPRVRLISFTGGLATGLEITRTAGIKKLILEMGSNSAVIILDDADLDRAVPAVVSGAFTQAGQNCLGVQRLLVQKSVYSAFRDRIVRATAELKAGHSLDGNVDVCAMITEREAVRVETWIQEAVAQGATVLTGGGRDGAVVQPTVMEDVPDTCRIACDEVYGPVVCLRPVADLDEAITRANSVPFGLHAAVFTNHLDLAFQAVEHLQVGGVIINDSTDYRLDTMPFGGVKGSGIGREGIDSAVASMTEERVVCFNL
ncbi:MAG: glyceraldehyde-3-phosphate dehydrogenase (NADP+) [Rhodothermales bacterium]|jgi:glyceraldehyde-3-phosphate dehydrogenase (NADP+)